jgi:hypothetical protein
LLIPQNFRHHRISGLEALSTVITATSERQQPHNQINSKKLRMKQFVQFKQKYDCQKIIPIPGLYPHIKKTKQKKISLQKLIFFFLAFQSSRN